MKRVTLSAALVAALFGPAFAERSATQAGAKGPGPARVPVVVELFTSEGCSSCPPADVVLSKIARDQPVEGVTVIPLGLHVTYWDQQGWKDPASLQAATDRQEAYSHEFGPDSVYTPQAVIDGREALIGSDEDGVLKKIASAAKQPHIPLTLTVAMKGDSAVATLAPLDAGAAPTEALELIFFITEDGLSSVVRRGENGGHTLHNDAVVRRLLTSSVHPGRPATIETAIPAVWHREHLHVVAILQGLKTRRIWGAAIAGLK